MSNSDVARMKRSAIRGRSPSLNAPPGFHSVPSGLRPKNNKEAERRETLFRNHRTFGCGSAPLGAARLPAFHHGSRQRDSSSPRLSFRPRFPRTRSDKRYLSSPVPVQRSTSHPGRNAGRLMPKPPENGLQIRPREPHSPRRPGVPPGDVLTGRECHLCNLFSDDCQQRGDGHSRLRSHLRVTAQASAAPRRRTHSSRIADRPPRVSARRRSASNAASRWTAPA